MSMKHAEEAILDTIAEHANKSEKMSWERKHRNLKKFMTELEPIEEQMIDLIVQKEALMDRITITRNSMVDECIHPKKYLVIHDGEISCKFCDRKFGMPDGEA